MAGRDESPRRLNAVAIGLLAAACLLAGAAPAEAKLVFKRPNGKVIPFSGTPQVWCGPWEEEEGVTRPAIHVELREDRHGRFFRLWELSAVQADITPGTRVKLPNSFVSDRPRGALMFVGVNASRPTAVIEASTAEEESKGFIAFSQVSCELGGVVEFRVHALLGSEFFQGVNARVNGTFRGVVGEAPPLPISARSAQ